MFDFDAPIAKEDRLTIRRRELDTIYVYRGKEIGLDYDVMVDTSDDGDGARVERLLLHLPYDKIPLEYDAARAQFEAHHSSELVDEDILYIVEYFFSNYYAKRPNLASMLETICWFLNDYENRPLTPAMVEELYEEDAPMPQTALSFFDILLTILKDHQIENALIEPAICVYQDENSPVQFAQGSEDEMMLLKMAHHDSHVLTRAGALERARTLR